MKTLKKTMILPVILLLAEILMMMLVSYKYGSLHLTADDSAEMILAEQLSREGGILSPNWYYSTELRVLNTQIVMSLLFRFNHDWRLVRALGSGIHLALLAFSWLFFCACLPDGRRYRRCVYWLLLPLTPVYHDIVIHGLFYIPHLCILFLTLGLCSYLQKHRSLSGWSALILLSFLAGAGGIRMIVTCYAALPAAWLLEKILFRDSGKREGIIAAAALLSSSAGYVFNAVLLKRAYHYYVWNDLRLQFQISRIPAVIRHIAVVLGVYKLEYGPLRNCASLLCGAAVLILAFLGIRLLLLFPKLAKEERLLLLFGICSFCCTAAGGILTNMQWNSRYLIMSCSMVLFLPGLYRKYFAAEKRKTAVLLMITVLVYTFSAFAQIDDEASHGRTDLRPVISFLEEEGLRYGVGDWGASDELTELSNGSIRMVKVTNWKELQIWYWLMDTEFREEIGESPLFVLLPKGHLNYSGGIGYLTGSWQEKDLVYLSEGEKVYEDEKYRIYVFDSFDQLFAGAGNRQD